jgi:hypothetical protein
VTDGTANLVSNTNFVVKDPYLGDVNAGFKMVTAQDGSYQVQRYSEVTANGALVDRNEGSPIQLNDARGNNYVSSYLPVGYKAVGFDADYVVSAGNQTSGHWQFDLILRGDDPVTGDNVYVRQRFEEDGSALRNTSRLSDVDVVLLETELHKDYSDTDNWRQVDINGDGVLGLNFNGPTLASSGLSKVVDAGSGLLLVTGDPTKGATTKDPVSLANSVLLTNSDGTKVFELAGAKAAAITPDGFSDQVLFASGSPAKPSYLAQTFDDAGHALGSIQVASSQSFAEAQRLGVVATTNQITAENLADPSFTTLVPSDNQNRNQSGL